MLKEKHKARSLACVCGKRRDYKEITRLLV